MKTFGFVLLLIVLLVLTAFSTEKIVSGKYNAEIIKLKGDVAIYQSQAENYSKVLRSIRESAATATPVEKAQ